MVSFRYSTIDPAGKWESGVIEGHDRGSVLARLNDLGHHPVEVIESTVNRPVAKVFTVWSRSVSYQDVTSWCRELGWLLRAGMDLNDGLEILAAGHGTARLGPLCVAIRSDIRKGKQLHDAMAATNMFSADIVSMVEVAEATGTLPVVLERIAQSREHMEKMRERVTSALIYPALLVTIAIVAVSFIMYFIVPTLKNVITGTGGPIPEGARLVIDISDWLIIHGKLLLALGLIAVAAAIAGSQFRVVREAAYTLATYVPILGKLLRSAMAIQFCRTLATLLEAGVSLAESLRLMKSGSSSPEIRVILDQMEGALRVGGDFVEPLARSRIFPVVLSRMLHVGHETGNFTPSLLQATEMQQAQFARSIERAMALLEPIIILLLSVFVGSIIISLMGAVISMNDLAL